MKCTSPCVFPSVETPVIHARSTGPACSLSQPDSEPGTEPVHGSAPIVTPLLARWRSACWQLWPSRCVFSTPLDTEF
jgi:hypothetical protein